MTRNESIEELYEKVEEMCVTIEAMEKDLEQKYKDIECLINEKKELEAKIDNALYYLK